MVLTIQRQCGHSAREWSDQSDTFGPKARPNSLIMDLMRDSRTKNVNKAARRRLDENPTFKDQLIYRGIAGTRRH